jgi:cell wall-associated NlpC family hydrolase
VKTTLLVSLVTGPIAMCCMAPVILLAAVANGERQSAPTATAEREIPSSLLLHYQRAPACTGLPWQVVAAIGYVESRHGSAQGARLDPTTGEVSPPIVGAALDGGGRTSAVRVPEGGSPWHDDPTWDHAVGPMQFITSTWARWGVDGSGDGRATPHNAYDAIATAGRYLCGNRTELRTRDDLTAAIRTYNNSDSYLRSILDKAYAYGMTDGGDPVLGSVEPPSEEGGPQIGGDVASVVAYAVAQIGDPYVWGADGPDAFDCSGLTMAAYQQAGIRLPHRSDLQVRYGAAIVGQRRLIRPGDLIFLRGGSPVHDYGHVGLAISTDRWVVAPRSGEDVQTGPIPFSRIQAVRRLIAQG